MNVFFYGLFMDKERLAGKSIYPRDARAAYVDGFALRIGQRATLQRSPGARAHGVMMSITATETDELYAGDSVADYLPEPVRVEFVDGSAAEAICYNLPSSKLTGSNAAYAASLLEVATDLGFPEDYLQEIRDAGKLCRQSTER